MQLSLTNKVTDERREALLKLSDLIVDVSDPDDLSYAASEILGESLGVSRVGYSAVDPDVETLHTSKDWCAPGVASLTGVLQLRDYGSFVDSLKRGEFISIADVREDVRTASAAGALENASARAFVNVPVIEQGCLRAVMYVNHAQQRYWTQDELLFIQEVARRTRTAMQRLSAEAEVRMTQERLQLALSVANGVGTWVWDIVKDEVVADEGFSRIYGVDPARGAAGAPIEEFVRRVHRDDRKKLEEEIREAIRSGNDFSSEYRLIQDDRSIRWVLARGRCVFAEDGTPIRFPGVTLDITEQKRLAASADETQKQLGLVLDGAGLAAWFYDPVREVVGGDSRMAALFDLEVQEGPAELWLSAIHPDDRDRVGREFGASIQGEPYDTEYRVSRKDGSTRWVRARAQLSTDAGKSRMVGICEDFTDRKRIEEELRNTATRLGLAQQTGRMAAWEWDLASGNFVWDEGSEWTYGRPPSEMSHVDVIFPYLHEDDREKVRRDLQPAIDGRGPYRSEFRVFWPDGSLHWIQAFGKSILSSEGKPVAIVGINMDITDRKSTEQILIQTEKLAAVGRLASSIAHEINNPLESVTNLLFLAKNNPESEDLDGYLSLAERELRRVSAIANQTLKFYKQTSGPVPLSCTELFEETLQLYQGRLVNSTISVEERLRTDTPVVCLAGEIRQVSSNLIGNAIDAMPAGGRLFLRCREATQWKTGERGIAITVADTGTGMSKHVRERAFEAFYSTKGIGGTGLGLWVSKDLVEKNHGRLLLRSSTDSKRHGTVFTFFIPYEAATSNKELLG